MNVSFVLAYTVPRTLPWSWFPAALRAPASGFSGPPVPPGSWALLTVGLPVNDRTEWGHHVPHARAATGLGAPAVPRGTVVLIPDRGHFPAGACRFPATSPFPRQPSHRRGCRLTRHAPRVHTCSPVRSSPRLWPPGWNRAPLDLNPGLRTPPTRSRTTHAEVETGHRARTWNYTLNSHRSIDTTAEASTFMTTGPSLPLGDR